MKKVIAGDGTDSTQRALGYLLARNELKMANLILVGEPEDPMSLWLTDWESPLRWSALSNSAPSRRGTFLPARITRGAVDCAIGLEVKSLELTWSPDIPSSFAASIAKASPYQLAQAGFYDNWKVRIWRTIMPAPGGDADTIGAYELFGGRIGQTEIARGQIKWTVNSFLDVVNQKVPPNVIENTSTLASFKGATPPPGISRIPQFNVIAGSTNDVLILDCTFPSAHQIFPTNAFNRGYVIFNDTSGATLARVFGIIGANKQTIIGGVHYNEIQLYAELPWPPTPGVDTCFISAAFPLNQADGDYFGFPYVPAPETGM